MKELDDFTVEELHDLAYGDESTKTERRLARIALAAKTAKPMMWKWRGARGVLFTEDKAKADFVKRNCPDLAVSNFYAAPVLNSPELPDGWIKCSERMPVNSDIPCFVYCKDGVRRTGYFDGNDWAMNGKYYEIQFVTHWQPLPAPPTTEK